MRCGVREIDKLLAQQLAFIIYYSIVIKDALSIHTDASTRTN